MSADKQVENHERWIRQVVNLDDRHDQMPNVNGVCVGQWWRNIHVNRVEQVESIYLAGLGVNSAHSESVQFVEPDGFHYGSGHPLYGLQEHWEQVVRRDEPTHDTLLADDGTGQFAMYVETDEWERVEPQPYVWHGRDGRDERAAGTYRCESAYVCRVVHDRPQGDFTEWEGRNSTWRLYDNKVLTRDGLTVGKYTGLSNTGASIVSDWPDAAPVEQEAAA